MNTFQSTAAQCRICKNAIVVKVADDYPWPTEDLLKLATCNRCYDMRERRESATRRVKSNCEWVIQHPKATHEQLNRAKTNLETATKDYAIVIAEYYGSKTLVWSEMFAENLMENPIKWYEQLNFYRKAIREQL